MITAKQANTLTKLSIAKKALESAIDAFNDNIVKNPDTPVYTVADLEKSLNRYFPGVKYTKTCSTVTLDEIVNVCVMAAFINAQRISENNHRDMGIKFNEILGETVFEKVVELD